MKRELYTRVSMDVRRLISIGTAALGVGAVGVGLAAAGSTVTEVGAVIAGLTVFGAGYVGYRRQWEQADEIRLDERIEQVAYRSGELAFRITLGLAMALFVVIQIEGVPVTAREALVLLILSMVVARFGLYRWSKQQSV